MKRWALLASFLIHLAIAAVPSPESHFGLAMGADRKLAGLGQGRIVLRANGAKLRPNPRRATWTEHGGRPFIAATIASPDTLRKLDRYKEIQSAARRSTNYDGRAGSGTDREGKTVVLITCSIHATEVASTATAIEFAYKMLTEDKPKFRAILANTIFLLVPSLNPDGVDIVPDWYRKTLGTPYEGTSPPQLYQKYVGHDNNRDWYIFSQAETQLTISKLHNVWHPQIVYDVHQQGAYASRMFVPPWLGSDRSKRRPDHRATLQRDRLQDGGGLNATGKGVVDQCDVRLLDARKPLSGVSRGHAYFDRIGKCAYSNAD